MAFPTAALARASVLAIFGLAGCIDQGFTQIEQVDFFQQDVRQAVDLLIVIDNSCSMAEEQDNLASNFDALIGDLTAADVSWQIAVTTTDVETDRYRGLLMGGDDEIILRGDAGELDRVEYTRDWPFERGVALQLDRNKTRSTYNDSRLNWCPAETEYSAGHFGTPGERNIPCDADPVDPDAPDGDSGPRAPVPGDLVISEIMAQSLAETSPDSQCEWFEIANKSDDTIDLAGITILDRGNVELEDFEHPQIPSGITLEPYGVIVIGRSLLDNCGANVDVAFGQGLSLNDDIRVITTETPDAAEIFAENVAQGTIGTGIEQGLEAARLTFVGHETTLDEFGEVEGTNFYEESNGSWLREDANFSILFVSDEDDLSPLAAHDYVRFFKGLKGDEAFRDDTLVNLSAVVGKDPPPQPELPSCQNDAGQGWYGRKYLEVANEGGGLIESICEEDFAPIVSRLGLTLSGLQLEFALSRLPNLDSLVVQLFDETETYVRDLERDVEYVYVCEGNLIKFDQDYIPPSQHFVVAEYNPLPTGTSPCE